MFLNNPNNPEKVPAQIDTQSKLLYLNSNDVDTDDEIDIGELIRLLRRRGLIILGTTIALASSLSAWILAKPTVYEGTATLLVEPLNKDNADLSFITPINPFKSNELDYQSQINVLKSPSVMNTIVEQIQARYPKVVYRAPENEGEENLQTKLSVQQAEQTKIIEVSYKDKSEEKILFILNQIVDGYLEYQAKEYVSNLSQAIDFTEEQISRVRLEVASLESQLENFQQNNNLIDPNSRNQALTTQATFLAEESEKVQIELDGMKKLAQELEQKLNLTPQQGVIVSRLNTEPYYAKLIEQIKETETQIALEGLRFGFEHPSVKTLVAKKDELVALLNQETRKILGSGNYNLSLDFLTSVSNNVETTQQFFDVNNQIQVLEAKQRGLDEAWERLNSQIKNLSTTNKEYFQLQRELTTANESLNRLLALNENLQIEVARQSSPWKLITPIDETIIKDVSGTSRKIALILIASLFSGAVLGLLVDKLDSSFHTVEDVKSSVKLPLLGVIPHNKFLTDITNKKKKRSDSIPSLSSKSVFDDESITFSLDSYCSLYTNISLLSSDTSIRSIVVGAAEASEGKSTTSLFLAKAAALLGQRVLIVDADMRKPKIHNYLGIKNKIGLSNLIAEDILPEDVIQSFDDGLSVITAGSKPPNPTRLIASRKWQTLMQKFKQDFDLVIYDTPPLMGFSDGKILTPLTDGLVFVVRIGKTRRPNVQQVINDLQVSKLTVLGMVANGVKNYMGGAYYGYYNYKNYYNDER
ncbi:GumC family protein [Cyanobacterium sp. Dongsha4]|uniref:GumC family protein n=1 Tax=Cyanobacterium sp. DS4 TaxID=2878255 RepID=UPI002E7FB920|nr:polysaccharide biosynthesis tyrosine autokinase [Cyanobacterium sp. Dongsha4]WVK99943.1 polysaccharide biosynthesis tyrosine autokinase [Cyanobacterium sp. Dongsha4]